MEELSIADSLSDIDADEWNTLAGQGTRTGLAQPFLRHEFLSAMIRTGCVCARTGWQPQIITMRSNGNLIAAMPLFVKSHSWGEYVFDWAWADAYERHGLAYYPKLLCAVPFTPVTGNRLLARDDAGRRALLAAALELGKQVSSLHILFPSALEAQLARDAGMMLRRSVQFHWKNEGYADFDGFLARLSHRRRKTIRQERRRVRESGVSVRWLRGEDMTASDWRFFHRCYRTTYAAHGSSPYLSLECFEHWGATLPEHLLLVIAERDGQPIGASLLVYDQEAVYGRYWGSIEYVPLLHFECCYYQAIEFAIAQRIDRFEGGAQGEHKLFRGLLPVETQSAHWLAHPQFAAAIDDYLKREGRGIERYVNELESHSPFKAEVAK